jgi:hypothetical protein
MAMLGAAGRRVSDDREPGAPPVPDTDPPAAAPSRQPRFSQTPERSGLPSGVLGTGAVRFTLPSAVRGTPVSGRFAHWAAEGEESDATSTTKLADVSHVFM